MIQVTKIIQATGNAPFTFAFTSSVAGVTFSTATGTSADGVIQTVISYPNETALTTAVITLAVTNNCGLSSSTTVNVTNPCATLTLQQPVVQMQGQDYVFSVLGSSTNGSTQICNALSFNWIFDTQVWQRVSVVSQGFQSVLRLRPLTRTPPTQTTITITATDCNGCSETINYNYGFCRPTGPDFTVNLYGTTTWVSGITNIQAPQGCINFVPDWTTLDISLPTGFTKNATSNSVSFTATGVTPGTYTGYWTVSDALGIESNAGTITFIVHPASQTGVTITSPNQLITLDCDVNPGDVVTIDIESALSVQSGATVNWNSFQFLIPPTPIGSLSPTLTVNANGKRSVQYTVPTQIVQDAFSFRVCDTNGNCSSAIVYTIIDCVQPPTAEDDAYTVNCGTTTEFDVLQNDLDNGNPIASNTLTITEVPSAGTAVVANGKIQYTAPSGTTGSFTIKYTVQNASGAVSNEATVTITVQCAGVNQSVALCN